MFRNIRYAKGDVPRRRFRCALHLSPRLRLYLEGRLAHHEYSLLQTARQIASCRMLSNERRSGANIDQYSLFHLVGDIVGLVNDISDKPAVVIGHDWGAPVAWHCALFRPDRFRAVAGLSVPFRPRGPVAPTTVMPKTDSEIFYQLYFQADGVAEKELEHDVRKTILWTLAGRVSKDDPPMNPMVPRRGGWHSSRSLPSSLPRWITEADIDFYVAEFERTGFRGGLNWYRNVDRNWGLMAPWSGAKVTVPAIYMAGEQDLVVKFPGADQLIANLKQFVPKLQQTIMLPDCGHWTQQEKPDEVNSALITFLNELHSN
jgi:pimeloyl-ACP methyl ester carboxylesterase